MDFTNTPAQFIFPVLKSADILQCMTELGIEMTKAELTEPHRHKDKIRSIFLQLLEICCGVSEGDLVASQPMVDKAASLSHPNLHQEGAADIKFFLRLRDCLNTCGMYDFSWKDLHAPTSKRLRWQLSAIVNLAKFREDQLQLYAELNEPRSEVLLSLDEVNKEHDQLKAQVEEVRLKSEDDYKAMEDVSRECEALTAQIAHSNKLQAAKREEASALKRTANDLKDELKTATWELEEAEAEEERLRSQVVSSPDRRQQELTTKRNALDKERDECANIEEKLQETKTMCLHVEEATKDMKNPVVVVKEVQEEAEKYITIVEQLETTTKEVGGVEKESSGVHENIVLGERDLNRTEEKIANLHRQHQMKMEAALESLEKAKSKLSGVEVDRRDRMAKIGAGAEKVRALEAEIENERLQIQGDIATMLDEFRETEEIVLKVINRRMEVMEETCD